MSFFKRIQGWFIKTFRPRKYGNWVETYNTQAANTGDDLLDLNNTRS